MNATRAAFAVRIAEPRTKGRLKRLPRWFRITLAVPAILFCLFVAAGVSGLLDGTPEDRARWATRRAALPTQPDQAAAKVSPTVGSSDGVGALDKMPAVFKGGYTRDQIDDLLSRTMTMYGSPLTETEYQRWGNALVYLRRTTRPVSEMDVLRCMAAAGPTMAFEPAAAICAVGLQNGL